MMATQSDAVLGQPRVARVAFLEQHLQALALRPLLGEPHQIARAVEAHDVLEAAPGELQAVPALAAAQVENVAVRLDLGGRDDEIAPRGGCSRRFSTTSPSVFTYRALKSLRHHSSGRCASRSATGPRQERVANRLGRLAREGITMVDGCPPRYRRQQPKESTASPPGADPRPVDTRPTWSQQNAILSLAIFPVKLLSVDDGRLVQARKSSGAPSPHELFPP